MRDQVEMAAPSCRTWRWVDAGGEGPGRDGCSQLQDVAMDGCRGVRDQVEMGAPSCRTWRWMDAGG